MMKVFGYFIITMFIIVILYFLLGAGLFSGGTGNEGLIYTFSTIIIILLSFMISLLISLIELLKENFK